MIVVEHESCLEMRDCLVRSSRHYGNEDASLSEGKSDWTLRDRSNSLLANNFIRDTKRDSIIPGSEIEDIAIWVNGDNLTD
jgi:hypothetical protein